MLLQYTRHVNIAQTPFLTFKSVFKIISKLTCEIDLLTFNRGITACTSEMCSTQTGQDLLQTGKQSLTISI